MLDLFDQLPQQLVNGLTLGSIYALIALGYSMVYGILQMLNFAHGEVFMIGGFIGWLVLSSFTRAGVLITSPVIVLLLMLLMAMAATALLGGGIEWFAYRPLRGTSRLAPLISALGVSIFLQNVVMLWTGARAKVYSTDLVLPTDWQIEIAGASISFLRLTVVVVAVLLMFFLDYLTRKTDLGIAMRATAEDLEAASYMGIRINTIIAVTFIIGSALAGAAGVLVGLYYTQVDFYMGFAAGLKAFTAAVLGGIGNIRGAMLGGVVLGLAEALGAAFIDPVYKDVIAFTVLVLVIIFRPTGLLGEQVPDRA